MSSVPTVYVAEFDERVLRPTTGSMIDGFCLGSEINAGGTAFLFRIDADSPAMQGLPFVAAMKIPRIGKGQPIESMLGFETEAAVLQRTQGAHVPRFVAAGDVTRLPYLAMEWIDGRTLEASLAEAPLAVDRVTEIGAALADAIHDVHRQGVIHHDIKPDNVILRPDGRAVLLDFGFAHHRHVPDLLAEETRFAAGSAPYLSPEQLTGRRDDKRSDLFALGVVLYELATGTLPFGNPPTLAAMRNRLWASPVPLRARVPGIAPWLQEIVLRCLEPDPAARYQSAAHVAFDLRNPQQVRLTPRAARRERPGFWMQLSLWWRSRGERGRPQQPPLHADEGGTPIILVAVDTAHPEDERHPALQWTVRQLASLNLEFRLICLTAIRGTNGDTHTSNTPLDDSASGRQLMHRVRLRHWIEPLGLKDERVTLHVIESDDPATALLEFARHNHVDLIVIGAPAPDDSALAWWRSTASAVTSKAHCSVHVVRLPAREERR